MVIPLGDSEPTRITPFVSYGLIALNVAVYGLQLVLGPRFATAYAATPWEIISGLDLPSGLVELEQSGISQETIGIPVVLTLITSLFLHASPLHLVGNMLYLWIFGDNVEELLGKGRFLLGYLVCGVVGNLVQVALAPDSVVPILGASAAVAGVMGVYLICFPQHRIRVLVIRIVVEIPALWVIVSWIVIQAVLSLVDTGTIGTLGGVAHAAHLGGAVLGIAAGLIYRQPALDPLPDDWVPPPRPIEEDSAA